MSRIKYSPQLDGLRAICIIFTLFNHVHGVPSFINGSVGVDIFFALSGFLITGILLETEPKDLKGYYIRRVFRIMPVYYLAFFITALAVYALYYFKIDAVKISQLKDITVYSILFSRELYSESTLFGQAWTVGIEEKFYLIWPLLFVLLLKTNKQIVYFLAFLLLGLFLGGNSSFIRGYGGITLGSIASILYFRRGYVVNTYFATFLIFLAYFLILVIDLWYENLLISLAAAFLIPSLYSKETIISKFLSHSWMVSLGKLTFSIYMFHVLILQFSSRVLEHFFLSNWVVDTLVGYICSVVFSFYIYKWYEYPLIKLGKKLSLK